MRLNEFFNVGKRMNEEQISETAQLFYDKYYFWKPEDLDLCLKKAKSGEYGQLFDRLDGAVIMSWCDQYEEARQDAVRKEKKEFEDGPKNIYQIFQHPELQKALKKVHVEITDRMKHKSVQEFTKPPLQFSELESYMEYLWETVKDNHSYTVQGITVAKVKGKEYTREEYLKKKYRQYGILQERRMKSTNQQ